MISVETTDSAAEQVSDRREPKVVAFVCSWCASLGADLAGTAGIQYPANVRIVRVPCCSRIDPLHIVRALQTGIDGVLVVGCHPGDCHYVSGNRIANRKFALLKSFLTYIGIDSERFQYAWVSGVEGSRFAALAQKITDDIIRLGSANELAKQP